MLLPKSSASKLLEILIQPLKGGWILLGKKMYVSSAKTKERLIKEKLSGYGIRYCVIKGEPWFSEETRMEIPTAHNFSFLLDTEVPIMPFSDDNMVTDVMAGHISRVVAIEEAKKMYEDTMRQNDQLRLNAEDAAGELVEFLEHIKNPRVQVL